MPPFGVVVLFVQAQAYLVSPIDLLRSRSWERLRALGGTPYGH
jgi:hypothetical protein